MGHPLRNIVHLDQDTFFVSVERLRDNHLVGRPVIIGGMGDRGVVASCSYEARQFGVHSAMPMKLARQLCADATYIRGDIELYSKYSRLITDVIADKAPLFEKASIDEHYIDITGMDRFFGCRQWASELRQSIIKETGLPISMGLSPNKTVSKIATGEAKPNGQLQIKPSVTRNFLDPLSIRKIPMIGAKTYHNFRNMGVATIRTLRQIPREMLQQMMGKNGLVIWQRANGIDNTPVQSWSEQKSISSETTLEKDTIDLHYINTLLIKQCEELTYKLRRKEQLTGCISVKIRYANFDTHSLQQSLPYTSFDHVIIPACKELFRRLHTRRMRIRLVGVQFNRLIRGRQQLNMFEDTTEMARLYQVVDKIRRKYGTHVIGRAV